MEGWSKILFVISFFYYEGLLFALHISRNVEESTEEISFSARKSPFKTLRRGPLRTSKQQNEYRFWMASEELEAENPRIFRIKRSPPTKRQEGFKVKEGEDDNDSGTAEKLPASQISGRGSPWVEKWGNGTQLNATTSPYLAHGAADFIAKVCVSKNSSDLSGSIDGIAKPACSLSGNKFCPLTEDYKDYPVDFVYAVVDSYLDHVRQLYESRVYSSSYHGEEPSAPGSCEFEENVIMPMWAEGIVYKNWMLIINTADFPQSITTKSCLGVNSSCSLSSSDSHDSTCEQEYNLRSLVCFNPCDPTFRPVVSLFEFPTGCSCKVNPARVEQELVYV